jgi:hypothetical protein
MGLISIKRAPFFPCSKWSGGEFPPQLMEFSIQELASSKEFVCLRHQNPASKSPKVLCAPNPRKMSNPHKACRKFRTITSVILTYISVNLQPSRYSLSYKVYLAIPGNGHGVFGWLLLESVHMFDLAPTSFVEVLSSLSQLMA